VKVTVHSYRFAQEIFQHTKYILVWQEIVEVCQNLPLFVWPGKSANNGRLDVVQQLLNVYFDRRLAIDLGWEHHPLATDIVESGLRADFRKSFSDLSVQMEVQFGNMARWYSDIFKFQTAYSQELTQAAVSILPMGVLGRRIDSNIAHYERALRELPSANLSITLPILLVGLEPDAETQIIDVSQTQFATVGDVTGKNKADNLWRVVNGFIAGTPMSQIGPQSEIGPRIELTAEEAGGDIG
jgi:hypothetical protein